MVSASGARGIEALDVDRLEHHVIDRPVVPARGHIADRVDYLPARGHLAEDGVLAGQPGRGHRGDEELRAVGPWSCVRHGEQVGPVECQVWVYLVGELVAGAAGAGPERVAALDHEVRND